MLALAKASELSDTGHNLVRTPVVVMVLQGISGLWLTMRECPDAMGILLTWHLLGFLAHLSCAKSFRGMLAHTAATRGKRETAGEHKAGGLYFSPFLEPPTTLETGSLSAVHFPQATGYFRMHRTWSGALTMSGL